MQGKKKALTAPNMVVLDRQLVMLGAFTASSRERMDLMVLHRYLMNGGKSQEATVKPSQLAQESLPEFPLAPKGRNPHFPDGKNLWSRR